MINTVFAQHAMERYLLNVRYKQPTQDGVVMRSFDKLFSTWQEMKDYIMQRDFFFVDPKSYTEYDLAIELR